MLFVMILGMLGLLLAFALVGIMNLGAAEGLENALKSVTDKKKRRKIYIRGGSVVLVLSLISISTLAGALTLFVKILMEIFG